MKRREDCIFCKIVAKEIPAKIEDESEFSLAFYDIQPKAKTHLLIVPKKHIATLKDIGKKDSALMGNLLTQCSQLAKKLKLENYRISINVGAGAGQIVFHLHLHLMSVE